MRDSVAKSLVYNKALVEAATVLGQVAYEVLASDDEVKDALASPLEAVFAVWWHARAITDMMADSYLNEIELRPQVVVKIVESVYRLDFVIESPDPEFRDRIVKAGLKVPLIGVELDDDASHHSTRNQIDQRNRRDSDLQTAGWVIFHFSEKEILADPMACIAKVWKYAENAFVDLRLALHKAPK